MMSNPAYQCARCGTLFPSGEDLKGPLDWQICFQCAYSLVRAQWLRRKKSHAKKARKP